MAAEPVSAAQDHHKVSPMHSYATDSSVALKLESLSALIRRTEPFCRILSALGMYIFMGLVALTFADVFLRYVFGSPISGSIEITEMLMSVVLFSSVGYTYWKRGHVSMDIITGKLSELNAAKLGAVTTTWSLTVVYFCIQCMAIYALKTSDTTSVWNVSYSPFIWFAVFGCVLLGLSMLSHLLDQLVVVVRGSGPGSACVLMTIAALGVALSIWIAVQRLTGFSAPMQGVIGMVFMFTLFFLGMPVAFALMGTSLVFIASLRGLTAALNLFGTAWFSTCSSYTWAPLMFFLLMGFLCFYSRFGEDLYVTARNWCGHLRGGLAIASVCACTALGAVVGDALVGCIAMMTIALPEMRRHGYDDRLAIGTLACSGGIGSLIPPSSNFIIYGVLAEQSIADLFIAGVFPGLVCMVCFIAAIMFMVWRKPDLAPCLPRVPMAERLVSLKTGLPIIVIFVVVIGGIYAGLFTATEGGGIGAFTTIFMALIMGRLSWSIVTNGLNDSGKTISMAFTVLGGAGVFSYFMTLSKIPMMLAGTIAAMNMPPMAVMFAIIVSMSVMGCFIPAIPLMLICVPIFLPLAILFGWNLIWFGVIINILVTMAGMTPPFGVSLFVAKELSNTPLSLVYRSSMPFVLAFFTCLCVVLLFPSLSTWLPAMMK